MKLLFLWWHIGPQQLPRQTYSLSLSLSLSLNLSIFKAFSGANGIRERSLAQMILPKNIGCRWSSSVFAAYGEQWQTPIWHENQWPLVVREKRPTSTNENQCFFAISFGLVVAMSSKLINVAGCRTAYDEKLPFLHKIYSWLQLQHLEIEYKVPDHTVLTTSMEACSQDH